MAYSAASHTTFDRYLSSRRTRSLETGFRLHATAGSMTTSPSFILSRSGSALDRGSSSDHVRTNIPNGLGGCANLFNTAESTTSPENSSMRHLFKTIATRNGKEFSNSMRCSLRNLRVYSTQCDEQADVKLSDVQTSDKHRNPDSSIGDFKGMPKHRSDGMEQVSLMEFNALRKNMAFEKQSASPLRKKDWYCSSCGNKNMRRWLTCKHCSTLDEPAARTSGTTTELGMQCLEKHAREGRWKQALRSLVDMDEKGHVASTSAHIAVIDACAKAGKWVEAVKLLNNMKIQDKAKLDVAVYIAVINACARASEVRAALGVLESMKESGVRPDLMTYNAALNACATRGWWQSAVSLFESMAGQGFQPNLATVNALMNSCRKGGNYTLGLEYFNSMDDEGLLRPNLVCFNTAIRLCAHCQDYTKALELLESMPDRGLRPDIHTINAVLQACASEGQWKEATELLTSVPARGLKPDETTFTSVMVACTKGGHGSKALALFDSMRLYKITPSMATFQAAISACEVTERPVRALELLDECKKSGHKSSGKTLNAALRTCAAASMWEDVVKLIDEVKVRGFKVENEDLLHNARGSRAKRRTELRQLLRGPGIST